MGQVDRIRAKFKMLAPVMDERMLRLWAAAEAAVLGRGGHAAVQEATGDRRQLFLPVSDNYICRFRLPSSSGLTAATER
jgi:hypothetical protein